jgi:hypothetical protein
MMNAAAFATGAFSGKSGFYGNTVYGPVRRRARRAATKSISTSRCSPKTTAS